MKYRRFSFSTLMIILLINNMYMKKDDTLESYKTRMIHVKMRHMKFRKKYKLQDFIK